MWNWMKKLKEYLVVDEMKLYPVALTTSVYGEPPTNGKKEPLDNCVVIVFITVWRKLKRI